MSTLGIALIGWALAQNPAVGDGISATAVAAALAAPDAKALAAGSLRDTDLAALAAGGDWRVRARAGAALQWRREPEFAAAVAGAAPIATRNGMARLVDRSLREPDAAGLLVDRLLAADAPAATRAALAEALPLSGGDWSEAAAGLLAEEPDASVRAVLAATLRDADAAAARDGLTRALADTDAGVRAAALRAVAGREDGADHAAAVLAAFRDPSAPVRAAAARAAGWLRLDGAWDGLAALLADTDADVRLQTLGALERLDATRAAGLSAVRGLRADRDARVARAAARLAP